MNQVVYVVQSFSRTCDGQLAPDVPAWSRDGDFAATLSRSLAKRKTGVVTLSAMLESSGRLSAEAEIVSAYGLFPLSLLSALPNHDTSPEASEADCPGPALRYG
jgi:hypothetical protein